MMTGVLDQLREMRESVAASLRKDPRYLTIEALGKSIEEIATVLRSSASTYTFPEASSHIGRTEAGSLQLDDVVEDQIAKDNLELRARFMEEVPTTTLAAMPEARTWIEAGDIFAVEHRGHALIPSFQLKNGQADPRIKDVLQALPRRMTPWQRAFWFVSTNGWLEDASPADRLDEIDRVLDAARHESAEPVG